MIFVQILLPVIFHGHATVGAVTRRTLSDILKDYQTIDRTDIRHHVERRSTSNAINDIRYLSFNSHSKKFHLTLFPSKNIFSSQLQLVTVDENGKETPIKFNKTIYYKGYLSTDFQSHANAYIEDDGMITAYIETSNDTYFIEPMWRHIDSNETVPHDMIVYKATDIKLNFTNTYDDRNQNERMCGAGRTKEPKISKEVPKLERRRRDILKSKNMCNMVLVADYLFFKNMGQGSATSAVNYMLQAASFVNDIFQATYWPEIGSGVGIQVKKVIVHTAFSKKSGPGYNVQKQWKIQKLLDSFSQEDWSRYCLAHLFTYQDFKNVLGTAYIANGGPFRGICAQRYKNVYTGHNISRNTAWSSSLNFGRRLLTREAQLVTAHEIGHNFGAYHDPSHCSSSTDGKYLMHEFAVLGDKPNNDEFSTCSKEEIAAVLKTKPNCLKKEQNFCGNRKVEEGEQCDPGLNSEGKSADECCFQCKFRSHAVCSDANSPCCQNCSYARISQVCRETFPSECKDITYCNGSSPECPSAAILNNGEECSSPLISKGNCINGKNCSSLCDQKGETSCSCSAGENACKICCKASPSSPCLPVRLNDGSEQYENDGMPCFLVDQRGYCLKRSCQKSRKKVKDEFEDLLNDFTFSKFARFMKANIVGTILIFSVLVWVPASCIVHYNDTKQDEMYEEMKQWMNPLNDDLVRKEKSINRIKMLFTKGQPEQTLPKTQYHISS